MKIAFVVQRYGTEIVGGSESYCRLVAERLKQRFEVEVLTTCALDYATWQNHYASGDTLINGVLVRRFTVDSPREPHLFTPLDNHMFHEPHGKQAEVTWNRLLGPYSTALFDYIDLHQAQYDCFLFVTYLYSTAYFGLRLVREKSILIPTAHDEPHIYLSIYDELFHAAQYLICLAPEEEEFIQRRFPFLQVPMIQAGINSAWKEETPEAFPLAEKSYRELQRNLNGAPYLLYLGRVVPQKGCDALLDNFQRYRLKHRQSKLKLVLMGEVKMPLPDDEQVIATGFVTDSVRDAALRECLSLVVPSENESLSLVLLEAWMAARPALVNARCAVLEGQCLRSAAGLTYRTAEEFISHLRQLESDAALREELGEKGREFVRNSYRWDEVEAAYCKAIEAVTGAPVDAA